MVALEKNIMRPRVSFRQPKEEKEFEEKVVEVQRISRVAKGGRRIRFRALVVLGDKKGRVGMGVSKANEVADAVKKATKKAKGNMVTVPIVNGTIPHEVYIKKGSARIIFRPATPGTSIVAGGAIRQVLELVGVTDILSKIMGSRNKINNVTATIEALTSFKPEVVEKIRGFEKKEISKSKEKND